LSLTTADHVWNRAALAAGGPTPRDGDRALADLLFAHGLIVNGGMDHLVEAAQPHEIAAATRAFRFLGLDRVAELLDEVTSNRCDPEDADERYGNLVPEDDVLVRRFEAFFKSSPEAFGPLESLPCAACGFLTLSEDTYGSFEICEVCGWEDDGVQLANPACGGGANPRSLVEAQAAVRREVPHTVTERNGILRSLSWRPLNRKEIEQAEAQRAREYWANRGVASRWECYWNGGRPFPKGL
jgi:hypothetical protein